MRLLKIDENKFAIYNGNQIFIIIKVMEALIGACSNIVLMGIPVQARLF